MANGIISVGQGLKKGVEFYKGLRVEEKYRQLALRMDDTLEKLSKVLMSKLPVLHVSKTAIMRSIFFGTCGGGLMTMAPSVWLNNGVFGLQQSEKSKWMEYFDGINLTEPPADIMDEEQKIRRGTIVAIGNVVAIGEFLLKAYYLRELTDHHMFAYIWLMGLGAMGIANMNLSLLNHYLVTAMVNRIKGVRNKK